MTSSGYKTIAENIKIKRMKPINRIFFTLAAGLFTFTACQKADDLVFNADGKQPVLSVSSTNVAPPPADSNKVVLTLNWTSPQYAQDSSLYKYIVEIDSSGRGFAKSTKFELTGTRTLSWTGKQLNGVLLSYGFSFNVAYDVDLRVTSSYANNNEKKVSNTVKIKATPFKIPPKVALPTTSRLFMVGDATYGWNDNNGNVDPKREFTRIDETTWVGIFDYNSTGSYKIWEAWGDWGTQFRYLSGNAFAGTFEKRDADPGWSSPGVAGPYKMTMDFQFGTYKVTSVSNSAPVELWITGDATTTSWTNNPSSNPAQKFTHLSSGLFEITIALQPGNFYKFLSSPGNWQPQFGGSSDAGGDLGANYGGGGDPAAVPTPATAGNYKITVNFITNKYTVQKL
jgi:hypothetical protein